MTLPAIDASGAFKTDSSSTSSTSFNLTGVSTTSSGDLLVVCVTTQSESLQTVSSVTSTGLTFTKLGSVAGISYVANSNTYYIDTEVWTAPVTGTLSSATVTVNISGDLSGATNRQGIGIIAFGISNPGSFDATMGTITNSSGAGTTAGQSYSTANPSLAIIVQYLTAQTSSGNVAVQACCSSGAFGSMGVNYASNASAVTNSTNLESTGLSSQALQWIMFAVDSEVTSFALNGAAGSYSITGDAAALLEAHNLNGTAGSYAISGDAATMSIVIPALTTAVGSYSITGDAAALLHNRAIQGAVGSYTITGDAAKLLEAHLLGGAVGSYSITGKAAELEPIISPLTTVVGSYTITGTAAALLEGHALSTAVGSYSITGEAAEEIYAKVLDGAVGSYEISGDAAGLFHDYVLGPAAGSYAISGDSADLESTSILMDWDEGAYSLNGASGRLLYYPLVPSNPEVGEREGGGGIAPKEIARDREMYGLFRGPAYTREIEAGVPTHPVAARNLTTPYFPASRPSFVRPTPTGKPIK